MATGMDDDTRAGDGSGPMPEPAEPTPFEKFEDLARRLVKVPKSEIKSERKASKHRVPGRGQARDGST